jgi:hypothetical protein
VPPGVAVTMESFNGRLGLVAWLGDEPMTAMAVHVTGTRVDALHLVANPDSSMAYSARRRASSDGRAVASPTPSRRTDAVVPFLSAAVQRPGRRHPRRRPVTTCVAHVRARFRRPMAMIACRRRGWRQPCWSPTPRRPGAAHRMRAAPGLPRGLCRESADLGEVRGDG